MFKRMVSTVAGVLGKSGFESYLDGVQSHSLAAAPGQREALMDYIEMKRGQGQIGPW